MLLRSILVGLDGSAFAESAIQLAIRWAKRFDCPVTGVGIVDEPTIRASRFQPLPVDTMEELLEREKRHVVRILDQFTLMCEKAGDIDFQRLMNVGIAYEQLTIEAQRFDIILLGQHTYFRHHTFLTDDETAEQAIKHAPRPIVAVPKQLIEGQGIVIAYDGKFQAARAVQALAASGLCSDTKIWVLSVSKSEHESAETAERAVEYLKSHDIQAAAIPVASKHAVHKSILEEAQKLGAEFVVMGAYGQPAIHEFFLGSVTQKMLDESPIPLFLYH